MTETALIAKDVSEGKNYTQEVNHCCSLMFWKDNVTNVTALIVSLVARCTVFILIVF